MGAWITYQIGSAGAVQKLSTPLHHLVPMPHIRPDATFPASPSNRLTRQYRRG
jgi:hypothetical protein